MSFFEFIYMEEYRTGPAIIDETVRVAKKYLEEHPEENSYQRGDSKTNSAVSLPHFCPECLKTPEKCLKFKVQILHCGSMERQLQIVA